MPDTTFRTVLPALKAVDLLDGTFAVGVTPMNIGALGATAYVIASNAGAKTLAFGNLLKGIGCLVWVCDGIDDQVEINAAITAVNALGGGSVSLSEGTFTCNNQIIPRSNVNIEGQGWATILKIKDSYAGNGKWFSFSAVGTTVSNVRLAHFKVDGNAANQAVAKNPAILFDIERVNDLLIERIWCDSSPGENFHLSGSAFASPPYRATLRDCQVTNFGLYGNPGYYSAYEIDDGCTDILLDRCTADTPVIATYALCFDTHHHNGDPRCVNITFRDCIARRSNSGSLLVIAASEAANPDLADGGILIDGGYYEAIGGVSAEISGDGAKNITIKGVTLKNTRIKFTAHTTAGRSSNILIEGVNIRGSVVGNPAIEFNKVDDSQIVGVTIENARRGAIKLASCTRVKVLGGNLKNNCLDANNTYDSIAITDDGASFSTYCQVIGPTIIETAGNKARYGISENAAGDNFNKIINPQIDGAVTAPIYKLGAMTEIVGGFYEELYKQLVVPELTALTLTKVNGGDCYNYPNRIRVFTSATASSSARKTCPLRGIYGYADYTKRKVLQFSIMRSGLDTESIAYIQLKAVETIGDMADEGIGLRIDNLALLAESYGGARATVAVGNLTQNIYHEITILFDPSTPKIEWYMDGILVATQSTANNIPSGTASDMCLVASIGNGATGGVNANFDLANFRLVAYR